MIRANIKNKLHCSILANSYSILFLCYGPPHIRAGSGFQNQILHLLLHIYLYQVNHNQIPNYLVLVSCILIFKRHLNCIVVVRQLVKEQSILSNLIGSNAVLIYFTSFPSGRKDFRYKTKFSKKANFIDFIIQ